MPPKAKEGKEKTLTEAEGKVCAIVVRLDLTANFFLAKKMVLEYVDRVKMFLDGTYAGIYAHLIF
jgi:hypothetical protein